MLPTLLKEWICPDRCIVCSKFLDKPGEVFTCCACEVLLLERDLCSRCGKPYALNEGVCLYCHEVPRHISRIRALFPYTGLYKESVLRWKYSGIRKYGKGYADLMMGTFMNEIKDEVDGFIPIPISRKRYRQRGFNQALDLAHALSQQTHIPVYDILERCKETKPQSACKKEERATNIKGAISLKEHIPLEGPLTIAFIDDIYTTGSTVRECINVLEQTSLEIKKIYVLAVCLAI